MTVGVVRCASGCARSADLGHRVTADVVRVSQAAAGDEARAMSGLYAPSARAEFLGVGAAPVAERVDLCISQIDRDSPISASSLSVGQGESVTRPPFAEA